VPIWRIGLRADCIERRSNLHSTRLSRLALRVCFVFLETIFTQSERIAIVNYTGSTVEHRSCNPPQLAQNDLYL